MAGREKVSIYMIFLVITFGFLGLTSFQTLKERKNSTILLAAKYKEIDDLSNQYKELSEATKKSLLQAKEEKDNLIHKIKDLENNEEIYHVSCKEDKEKYKIKKDQEITTLKEKIHTKDIELTKIKAKIEQLKLDNKKINGGMVIKTVVKDDFLEKNHESLIKDSNNKDLDLRIPISQNVAHEEKINDVGTFIEERVISNSNITNEAKAKNTKVEDVKAETNLEVDKSNRIYSKDNELKASKAFEEDDAKELEVDIKMSDFNGRESNESLIQE